MDWMDFNGDGEVEEILVTCMACVGESLVALTMANYNKI